MTILVAVIYAAFISLGLPDAVVGAAWPSMAPDLGADKAAAGIVAFIITSATILVSFASGFLLKKFGTFKVSLMSVALTAAALAGYGLVPNFWSLCLMAVPLGLGGGAIDAALNSYAAIHFSARSMNLLHASWGIGASAGPLIVGFFLNTQGAWRPAYFVLAGLQLTIFFIILASKKLWPSELEDVADADDDSTSEDRQRTARYQPTSTPWYKLDGIIPTLAGFFCYCSLELTTGLWGATFFSLYHGLSPDAAAAGAAAFYIGLTGGRVLAAFITSWLTNSQLLTYGTLILVAGSIVSLTIGTSWGAIIGFGLVGLGCAPIFPGTIKETTRRFGPLNTPRIMGIQMGIAYSGMLTVPPLVGLLVTRVSPLFMPITILSFGLALLATLIYLEKMVVRKEIHAATPDH